MARASTASAKMPYFGGRLGVPGFRLIMSVVPAIYPFLDHFTYPHPVTVTEMIPANFHSIARCFSTSNLSIHVLTPNIPRRHGMAVSISLGAICRHVNPPDLDLHLYVSYYHYPVRFRLQEWLSLWPSVRSSSRPCFSLSSSGRVAPIGVHGNCGTSVWATCSSLGIPFQG